jgi:ADP-L-glycero-D-manno-heptose 6-epimerase
LLSPVQKGRQMLVVTGGAGFIGSNLVAALEELGSDAVAVCDGIADGKDLNIAKRRDISLIAPAELFDFLDGQQGVVDTIFHMGAISSTTEPDIDLINRTNVELPLRLWDWCAEHGVRLIYASSAATYGDGSGGFDDDGTVEALSRLEPLNPYGRSKNEFDRRVAMMVAAGKPKPPQWAGLKFFNVYGPNEYHKAGQTSVVYQVFGQANAGKSAQLFKSHHPDYSDGGQLRDFIWVGDCVDLMLWLLDNKSVNGLFNCGTGKARSFSDLASTVYRALGFEPKIDYVPTPESIRDKYQYFTQAEISRLRAVGYERRFTELEDGVTTYVQRYLDQLDPYR